jgi:hypothetical protein
MGKCTYISQMGDCVLLQYYAVSSDNSLPTLRDNVWVRLLKMGPLGCLQNVGKELSLLAA